MIVATLIWDPNENSKTFSAMYDETWVKKLYFGFARNLDREFRFHVFTDKPRPLPAEIVQHQIEGNPSYATCIQPYQLNEAMILVGLDTIVTANINHLADYCLTADTIALPRDPYNEKQACNGVALVPAGMRAVFDHHRGENDMEWMRKHPHKMIDDLFPGQVVSYKGHVKKRGLGDARIVYFHGEEKPHQLDLQWVKEHWRL